MPGCLASWLPSCLVPWLPSSLAAWFPCSLAPWLPGSLAPWLLGSLAPCYHGVRGLRLFDRSDSCMELEGTPRGGVLNCVFFGWSFTCLHCVLKRLFMFRAKSCRISWSTRPSLHKWVPWCMIHEPTSSALHSQRIQECTNAMIYVPLERKTTDEPIVTTFFGTKPMGSVFFPVRKQPLAHTQTQALQLAHMSNWFINFAIHNCSCYCGSKIISFFLGEILQKRGFRRGWG